MVVASGQSSKNRAFPSARSISRAPASATPWPEDHCWIRSRAASFSSHPTGLVTGDMTRKGRRVSRASVSRRDTTGGSARRGRSGTRPTEVSSWSLSFSEPHRVGPPGQGDTAMVQCGGTRGAWVLFLGSGAATTTPHTWPLRRGTVVHGTRSSRRPSPNRGSCPRSTPLTGLAPIRGRSAPSVARPPSSWGSHRHRPSRPWTSRPTTGQSSTRVGM